MKELSKDAEIKRTQPSKESIASTESEKPKTAEKTKHSALRLFRTVRYFFYNLFFIILEYTSRPTTVRLCHTMNL